MSSSGHGYNDGTNSLEGQAFIDEFLSERNMKIRESNEVVLVLMKSDEIDLIVEEIILGDQKKINPSITLEDRVAFWWIKAENKIVVDLDLASNLLGKEYNVFDFLVNVSSTVGRAFTFGNIFTITSELVGIESKLENVPDEKT
jgi:methane monooxygenase regulatory protein B